MKKPKPKPKKRPGIQQTDTSCSWRGAALNAAIERGERLAKIAEICKDNWEIGQTLPWHKLVQIYQLAKGVK